MLHILSCLHIRSLFFKVPETPLPQALHGVFRKPSACMCLPSGGPCSGSSVSALRLRVKEIISASGKERYSFGMKFASAQIWLSSETQMVPETAISRLPCVRAGRIIAPHICKSNLCLFTEIFLHNIFERLDVLIFFYLRCSADCVFRPAVQKVVPRAS